MVLTSHRVLFVTQGDFSTPSEMHVLAFAEQLLERGHAVMISMAGDPESATHEALALPSGLQLHQHHFLGPALTRSSRRRAQSFAPDVIHAWTPRVPVLPAARAYSRATRAPYVVHFEDDEWRPWPHASRTPRARFGRLVRQTIWPAHPPMWGQSTGRTLRMAAREAAGLDALTPALAAEVGDRLGRECTVILPATPSHRHFAGGASVLRREGEERIVLFTGRVVPTSLPDFVCAIRAVARLRERGIPARLVQTGAIDAGLDLRTLARAEGLDIDGLSLVGHIPFTNVLPTLRDADVLIQPGPPTRFNRLRLPSKLQLYLEAARPTITFSAGVGELLSEGDEVLMTHGDDPAELADLLWRVLTDGALHAKLSAGSLKASARLFDNSRNTDALLMYYRRSLGRIARERETEHRIPT